MKIGTSTGRPRGTGGQGPVPSTVRDPFATARTEFAADGTAPRLARAMVVLTLLGYLTIEFTNVVDARPGPRNLVLALACILGMFGLQLLHCSQSVRVGPRRRIARATLPAQVVLTYLPVVAIGPAGGGVGGFLAASILLIVRPATLRWLLFVAVVVVTYVVTLVNHLDADDTVYLVVATALTGIVVSGVTRMSDLVAGVHAAREDFANLAIEQERLRFAQDLHDLLGYSLSAIILKGELARARLRTDPDLAEHDLTSVIGVARDSLVDVRTVSRSYRNLSLRAQVASVRSMLGAADIHLETTGDPFGVPATLDIVLARVVREAVTNMLRHSNARCCRIELSRTREHWVLVVANDGAPVPPTAEEPSSGYGGLTNLRNHLSAVGGTLTTARSAEWFELTCRAPSCARSAPAGAPGPGATDDTVTVGSAEG